MIQPSPLMLQDFVGKVIIIRTWRKVARVEFEIFRIASITTYDSSARIVTFL